MRPVIGFVSALLVVSALPAFSSGHSTARHTRHAIAPPRATEPAEPPGPVTVYGNSQAEQEDVSGGPEVVIAGARQSNAAGQPEMVYGDVPPVYVYEIAAAGAASAEPSAMPLTVFETGSQMAAEGLPETVYAGGDFHPGPVHEAQLAADEFSGENSGEGMAEQPDTEQEIDAAAGNWDDAAAEAANVNQCPAGYYLPLENGAPLFRHGAGLPEETASPYSSYTDAQRAGMNPCEDKQPGPSPYGSMTDAQRAAQTNCR